MSSFTASGKPKRTVESLAVERRYRNVITLFLSGQLPNFDHQRHVHVANILRHLPYGRLPSAERARTNAFIRKLRGRSPVESPQPASSVCEAASRVQRIAFRGEGVSGRVPSG